MEFIKEDTNTKIYILKEQLFESIGIQNEGLKLILEIISKKKINKTNNSEIICLSDLFILNHKNISLLLDFIDHTLLYIIHILISYNHNYIKSYIDVADAIKI
jgi:hypothetical protein